MPRKLSITCESALIAIVLSLYGMASILGYGLHGLWGCDHCHHYAANQDYAVNQAFCSAGDEQLGLCTPESGLSEVCRSKLDCTVSRKGPADRGPSLVVDDSDCPICAFLAQVQTPIATLVDTSIALSLPDDAPVQKRIAPLYLPNEHFARGPPLS